MLLSLAESISHLCGCVFHFCSEMCLAQQCANEQISEALKGLREQWIILHMPQYCPCKSENNTWAFRKAFWSALKRELSILGTIFDPINSKNPIFTHQSKFLRTETLFM